MDQSIIVDIPVFFRALANTQGVVGPIGELTSHLASGETSKAFYSEIVERFGLRREPWFAVQRLDLLLRYGTSCLAHRQQFAPEELANLRTLRSFLHIEDGEFLEHRPAEVAHILREQLDLILEDAVIDREEDLYQVELQAVFGLGYDDYLSLTRIVFERVWADLQTKLATAGEDAPALRRKMRALEPLVRLATLQYRTVGALYS